MWCLTIGALNTDSARWATNALAHAKLLEIGSAQGNQYIQAKLTPQGWRTYHSLKQSRSDSNTIFMAMPFKHDNPNKAFSEFQGAVAATGFRLVRLDNEPKAGSIDDRIRVEIRKARMVIADLTGSNAGAYFEAGFAEGLGKPVVYTCEESHFKSIHFDTSHYHTVVWEIDKLDDACKRLKATIRNTLPEDAKMEDDGPND